MKRLRIFMQNKGKSYELVATANKKSYKNFHKTVDRVKSSKQ
jgi:hypothetical protein